MNRKDRIVDKLIHDKIEKRIKKKTYRCLHDGCNEKAIRSHSLQKNGPIKHIAEGGHVIALGRSLHEILNLSTGRFDFQFQPVGVKEISTFPGFCKFHDDLFACFERFGLDCKDNEHTCLLFYRSFCYEKARKRESHFMWTEFLKEKGGSYSFRALDAIDSIKRHITVTCEYHIQKAQNMIESKNYSELVTRFFIFDKNVKVACSTVINLHLDNYGEFVINNPRTAIPSFTLNLLPDGNKTFLIVSWLKEHNEYASWLSDTFESKKALEFLINRLCFCDSEDSVMSPSLWETVMDKQGFVDNMQHVAQRGVLPIESTNLLIEI